MLTVTHALSISVFLLTDTFLRNTHYTHCSPHYRAVGLARGYVFQYRTGGNPGFHACPWCTDSYSAVIKHSKMYIIYLTAVQFSIFHRRFKTIDLSMQKLPLQIGRTRLNKEECGINHTFHSHYTHNPALTRRGLYVTVVCIVLQNATPPRVQETYWIWSTVFMCVCLFITRVSFLRSNSHLTSAIPPLRVGQLHSHHLLSELSTREKNLRKMLEGKEEVAVTKLGWEKTVF